MINEDRLVDLFLTLCRINAPSKQEQECVQWTKRFLLDHGLEVTEDNAAAKIGGNASPGNSVVRRKTGGARQVIAQAFAGTPSLSQSSVAQRPMRFGSANAR